MRRVRAVLILAFLLTTSLAQGVDPASSPVPSPGTNSYETSFFYRAMQEQSEQALAEISRIAPEVPETFWRRAMKNFWLKVKGINPLPHAQEFARKYGATAGAAFLAGETTSWLMAPVFLYFGSPGLAALCTAPWGIPTAASVVYLKQIAMRRQVARQLGLKSLSDLNKLRREILGFDVNYYLMSAVYEAVHQEKLFVLSLNVTQEPLYKKITDQLRAVFTAIPEQPFVIDSADLIKLVKTAEDGAAFLKNIAAFADNQALYSLLLVKFIDSHPDLQMQMLNNELVKIEDGTAFEERARIKADLVRFKELGIELNFLREDLAKRVKYLQKTIKSLNPKKEAFRIRTLDELVNTLNLRVEELKDLEQQTIKREYTYLIHEQARRKAKNAPMLGEQVISAAAQLAETAQRIAEFRLTLEPILAITQEQLQSMASNALEIQQVVTLSSKLKAKELRSVPGIIPEAGVCGEIKMEELNRASK